LGLELSHIEDVSKVEYGNKREVHGFYRNIYAVNDEFFSMEFVEKTMTKAQIEKELGYKINIKD